MSSLNQTYSQASFNPPDYYKDIVCISNNYIYSAQISSCFNRKDTYFTVLEPPRSLHKYWANEFIMLNNVLAKFKPRTIIFAKVDERVANLIKKQLNLQEKRYLYIRDESQLSNFMRTFRSSTKGQLLCPPLRNKVAYALLEAKQNNLQLVIDSKSKYEIKHKTESEHIVISDSLVNILPVLVANYSFSINADIHISNIDIKYSPQEMINILDSFRKRGERGVIAKRITKSVKSELTTKLEYLSNYKFVTFFIDEFPYGYFFPEIPSTHIYNKTLPSYFIASSISEKYIPLKSALLVDTGFFEESETEFVNKSLLKMNVHTKVLGGNNFRNSELDKNIQFLPYDFLFICSHGGFPEGVRFEVRFTDKNNCNHIIVIDTIDSFYPTNKGEGDNRIIDVQTFYEFVELDGKPWFQKEYKPGSSKTVVEDFLAIGRNNWEVIKKKAVPMKHCNVIATKDSLGPYVPMIHSISDPMSSPLVFNNACSSTYTLATNFIFAGAGFYVGTVNSVGTNSAVKVARIFCEKTIIQEKPLAISLWESLNESDISAQNRVYICIGCHFTKFIFYKNQDNSINLKRRIQIEAIMRRKRMLNTDIEQSTKENHTRAIEFLINEFKNL